MRGKGHVSTSRPPKNHVVDQHPIAEPLQGHAPTALCEITPRHPARPLVIPNPEVAPMITIAELEKTMPDFQWSGGYSGRILPIGYAKKLEEMWEEFLTVHHDDIDGKTFNASKQYGKL